MPRFLLAAATAVVALTLSGCSVFYPNWGATGLPEEPFDNVSTPSSDIQVEPEASVDENVETSATAQPEATAEPEASPSPTQSRVAVEIMMAAVEPEFGVLTVIAQLPGTADRGGSCELRFIGGNTERVVKVAAEQSSDYTQCFPIELPLADLPSGNALVTVSYESERYTGRSAASAVVIP